MKARQNLKKRAFDLMKHEAPGAANRGRIMGLLDRMSRKNRELAMKKYTEWAKRASVDESVK